METPITDALNTYPAIEKRDVPVRVWREMARLERQRDEAVEALRCVIRRSDEFVRDTGMKHGDPLTDAVEVARSVLARIDGGKPCPASSICP